MPLVVDWAPCPLDSNMTEGSDAECAQVTVPLLHADPSKGTIDVFVKRKLAKVQPARAQLWFLNGGPGYSGADFEPLVANIYDVSTDLDQYLLDHRGVGRSSRLGCASGESPTSEGGTSITDAELPACVDELKQTWGDRLDGFSTTEASHDVGGLIDATLADGQQALVWGGSYGTIWANRYLQLYPHQPAAILLDAPVLSGDLSVMDMWFNDLGKAFFDHCAQDTFCASKLGADPWATLTQAMNGLDAGACPGISDLGFDRRTLQSLYASFFYSWDARVLVPALAYRLHRCDPADVAAFDHLAQALSTPQAPHTTDGYFSLMLSAHVTLSEIWADPSPTFDELDAFRDTANVAHGLPESFAKVAPLWPRYPRDEYVGKLASFDGPMLITHGQFDFVPLSTVVPVTDHFHGPSQTFVLLPRAPHGTLSSPKTMGHGTCGGNMLLHFVLDPSSPVDTSCLELIQPVDFAGTSAFSSAYLGTPDLYENPSPMPAPVPSGAGLVDALDVLRATPSVAIRRAFAGIPPPHAISLVHPS